MNKFITPFSAHNTNRVSVLSKLRKNYQQKIFGYFCSQIPEEIIHAAGILPIRILGNNESCERADSLLQSYVCSFSRNCLAMMLNGGYQFLDGVVISHTCDTIRGIAGIIKENIPLSFNAFIRMPMWPDQKHSKQLILDEYKIFMKNIERYARKKIYSEDLKTSISVYNLNRRLLKRLSKHRTGEEKKLTAAEFMEVCLSGFSMDKGLHNHMIERLLDRLKTTRPLPPGDVKLLVGGNVADNATFIDLIETLGGDVVDDDLCTGTRYFHEPVDEHIPDPLEAIVESYIKRTACACRTGVNKRAEHFLSLCRQSRARGVILLQQKFCDPHLWDYPLLKKKLENEGIALLLIEYEQPIGQFGAIKNRIQSFLEMLGG